MAFTAIHYVPSAISALLVIFLALRVRPHRGLALAMALLALLGLAGYLSTEEIRFYPMDFHVLHSWLGMAALLLSLAILFDGILIHSLPKRIHCQIGYLAAISAALALLSGMYILSGMAFSGQEISPVKTSLSASDQDVFAIQESVSAVMPEVEAREYQGKRLIPLDEQGNNAIEGTQYINRTAYRLLVTGLVNRELSLSYEELLLLPAYSEAAYMPCVEGWGFDAKWTGFRVEDLLNLSGLKSDATYIVFHSQDGYSTGLDLDYLRDNDILLAYGINDLTLPPERGFPLQLVAKSRFGYKWGKWITAIEVVDREQRGYWESRGYSNSAKVGEFPFG